MVQLLEEWLVVRRRCITRVGALVLTGIVIWTDPAFARNSLNCSARQVVIVYAPTGGRSSSTDETLRFLVDEASKAVLLYDGTPLMVQRFDDRRISAVHGDMRYEFDRQNSTLTYAGSTIKGGASTVTLGSGRYAIAPDSSGG